MYPAPPKTLDDLRRRFGDDLLQPDDPGYVDSCTLFNAMIELRPALVLRCWDPHDVAAALGYGREAGMEISVRAGGHSVAGLCLNEGGLVLDIRGMDAITVDPAARTARVGGGAIWADVDRETQVHGLATTGGRVSTTGVGGLTLGGGSGWLERLHGFACDNLVSARMVTADGNLVGASRDENPELFWALRGGGGNFGVVTEFEFRLHPLGPEVFGGMLLHSFEKGPDLMRAWRDVMLDAPDGLSLAFGYLPLPADDPELPAELRGEYMAAVAGMHAGTMEEGEELLAPVRAAGEPALDLFGPMPYVDLQRMLDDPPGYRNYWTAEQLADLPDEAIERLHRRCANRPAGNPQLFMPAWGGAAARVGSEDSPLTGRESRFIVHPLMLWEDPADDQASIDWARGFRDDMAEFSTGGAYLNFTGLEGEDRTEAQYGDNLERLTRVKAEWDPDDVFRASGNPRLAEPVTAGGRR